MLSLAPVSVVLCGVVGMFVVALAVLRMVAEERRYRGRGPAVATPRTSSAPTAPRPVAHVR